MTVEFIVDDRENPTHAVRTKVDRRISKVNYHLLKRPFKDSNGRWVTIDRRSGNDRRL
jgi:hypothetical protein